MTTPIDRESVERWECSACPRTMDPEMMADPLGDWVRYEDFRAALDAAEAEIKRLRQLIPRPDQTEDELVWRDHMRGVPLAALAKEFGVTRERMRHRLKKIAERKLHLMENPDG